MYSKTSRTKPSGSAKTAAILLIPAQRSAPKDALAAICDGCGAELWIPNDWKHGLAEANHKTFCLQCLQVRKVI